jgi:excisionase family DNA binding protein
MPKKGELISIHAVNREERHARSFQSEPRTEWLTAKEAAAHLRVKARTLLLWTRQGKINGYALSGSRRRVWRYLRAELDAAVLGRPVLSSISPSVLVTKGDQ